MNPVSVSRYSILVVNIITTGWGDGTTAHMGSRSSGLFIMLLSGSEAYVSDYFIEKGI